MQTNSLRQIIATLQGLRDVYHSQLNASDRAEFDDVLEKLEGLAQNEEHFVPLHEHAIRALNIIDMVIRLGTNLSDLIK